MAIPAGSQTARTTTSPLLQRAKRPAGFGDPARAPAHGNSSVRADLLRDDGDCLRGKASADGNYFAWDRLYHRFDLGPSGLLAQSGIERMREPDTRFLQLLPDDRGVRHDIGSIDRHFPCWLVTRRALSNAVFRPRLLRDSEGLVCPILRLRMGPALNSGRRDRFH